MKFHNSTENKSLILSLIDKYLSVENRPLYEAQNSNELINQIKSDMIHSLDPILIYGLRTQEMFAYIVAAMDKCVIINEEDSGTFYSIDEGIKRPDFLVITKKNQKILIEIKNHHKNDPLKPFAMNINYYLELEKYANYTKSELKIAIYWSKMNIWTLITKNAFDIKDGKYIIQLTKAMMCNEMYIFGDYCIGTTPSLKLRIICDQEKPRDVNENNEVKFTIGGVDLYAGKKKIVKGLERNLCFFLIMNGNWGVEDMPAKITDGSLVYFDFHVKPKERSNSNQHFEIIGQYSQFLCRFYNNLTVEGENVKKLSPYKDPLCIKNIIPDDYKGEELPIWKFDIRPNNDELKS